MDIVAWLPNPEQDLKTSTMTDGDIIISIIWIIIITIIFWYLRQIKSPYTNKGDCND